MVTMINYDDRTREADFKKAWRGAIRISYGTVARVLAYEVMWVCEVISACEVIEEQIKKQGRVSLARALASEVMWACEIIEKQKCASALLNI